MSYARTIVDRLGGTRKAARRISVELGRTVAPSTVQSWKDRGLIPAEYHQPIMSIARKDALPIRPDDFFQPAVQAA